jgi:hypothetical protein
MQNLDNSISEMYFKGYIDREEAIMRSSNPAKMEKQLVPVDELEATPSRTRKKAKDKEEAAVAR